MTYNIEYGFHTEYHQFMSHRMEAAQKAVGIISPDILVLIEASYASPNSRGINMDYKKIFNMDKQGFASFPIHKGMLSDEKGIAILSNFPMRSYEMDIPYKGALRAEISIDDIVLTIDGIHPSYSVSDSEKIETHKSLIYSKNEPYIVTGDFNTTHPDDSYDWDIVLKNVQNFNPHKAKMIIESWKNSKFIKWLQSNSLHDLALPGMRDTTCPTPYVYEGEPEPIRMDFAFGSSQLHTIDSYVLKNEQTDVASDHYPLVNIFEII